ncbi:unnamed protein product, partial [Brenthis ino]
MALTYLPLAILVLSSSVVSGDINSTVGPPTLAKASLDPKRRNDLVDEAFLEQKDILLDMLEAKLKEVRDKKKKKTDHVESNITVVEPIKCEILPKSADLDIKGNGVISVGEADVHLKFGEFGNSTLNFNATGISNIGKTYVNLVIGDGTLNIPRLKDIFSGSPLIRNPCEKQDKIRSPTGNNSSAYNVNLNESIFRRSLEVNNSLALNNPGNTTGNTLSTDETNKIDDVPTTILDGNFTTQDNDKIDNN